MTTVTGTVQPHTFPYLIDKFFYSAYGGNNTLDPGGLVGGYAADGWFKMFEFLEVPSQMMGSIGPVANGANFDWSRQDIKAGQLNLNLIIDEEVFFSVVGRQTIAQANTQYQLATTTGGVTTLSAQTPSDQFTQTNLNFDQIYAAGSLGTLNLPLGNYTPGGSNPNPFGNGNTAPWGLPLAQGTPPVPMVVTSTLANGSPASAYPIWNSAALYGGLLALDPITKYYYVTQQPDHCAGHTRLYQWPEGSVASVPDAASWRVGLYVWLWPGSGGSKRIGRLRDRHRRVTAGH